MKTIGRLALILLVMAAGGCASIQRGADMGGEELVVCGWDEVFILDLSGDRADADRKIWSWRAKGRQDLPEDFHKLFDNTDDCKPFDQGRKILITASTGGGVALVDREQDRVLFYARVSNAHSADLLPNNRVAVAASHSSDGRGDRLIVYDLDKPDQELLSADLPWGHGVVWDQRRQRLWALSGRDIRVYELQDWDSPTPMLSRISTIDLPERGGHDLSPISNSPFLSVSTGKHCWYFNRDTQEFIPHPVLAELDHVKSMSVHPVTHQLVYVQAKEGHWWTEKIRFSNPDDVLHTPGEHFYKARWNIRVK